MTRPSTSIVWNFVAGLALAAPCCCVARTLTLQAERVVAEQAELHDLNIVVETEADEASLAVSAASLRVPMLGLSGRVEWSCALHAAGVGTRECQGPVQFGDGDGKKRATLSARVGDGDVVLELGSGDSRVSIDVPLSAGAAIDARLQQVPAAWLRTPLAQVWKGGEVRAGLVSADARLHDDGRVEATFDLAGMTANTLDGTTSADRVSVTGNVESHVQGEGRRFAGQARMSGGRLRVGAAEVNLPDTPVDARFDATMRADGRWDLGELAWNDADALVFRASGTFDPSALAPLQELSVHVERARFPLVTQRYAKALLESAGFSDLAIKGELRGDIEANATGLQRLAFDTGALAIDDKTRGFAIHGLRGGIDWGVAGSRPARSIAWTSARFGTLDVPAASSRWQTRNGALHLVGRLRVRHKRGRQ